MSALPSADSTPLPLHRLWLADAALLSVAIIWGINIPVMKVALEYGITPYALNALRLMISAIILLTCAWWEFRGGVRPAAGVSFWRLFVYALVVSVAYQFLFLMAVSRTTSANIALIMATVPMWTALGARMFLKEILPVQAWLGLWIAFAGTMIVSVQSQQNGAATPFVKQQSEAAMGASEVTPSVAVKPAVITSSGAGNVVIPPAKSSPPITGNMIALVAALTWAGGTVFSRPLLRAVSPVQLAACSATIGLPFHLIFAGPTLALSIPLLSHRPLQLCILYSGILSTGLALAMWSYGVKHAGAAQATMFQNLSPIVAIAAAWIWRHESVTVPQAIGGVLIIGGLLIMRNSRMVAHRTLPAAGAGVRQQ